MRESILNWPAFSRKSLPSDEIRYEWGIWGKVPDARTDFCWVVKSSGLEREKDLAEQISLGIEDQPVRAQLWHQRGGRYYATGLYPSQIRDAAGRTGFLEKKVLAWMRPPDIPAALGAFLLLERVAQLDADVWWPSISDPARSESGFSLDLVAEPLWLFREYLEALVYRGVEELQEAVERKDLADLYAQILADRRPACLTGLARPLSPLALAALLLPLPRALADNLSVAGWIPSSRVSIEGLAAHWNVIILPPHLAAAGLLDDLGPDEKRQAWDIAEALLERTPELAWISTAPPVPVPVRRPMPVEPPVLQMRPAVSALDALRPGARIALPAPPASASAHLKELHSFACAVDRRWPDLDRWLRSPISQLEPIYATLFPSWIAQLQQEKPRHVDDEQWMVKLDLLRSAALVLCPGADTLRTVGLPKSRRVPALLFSLFVSKHLLAEMGQDSLRKALRHSLSCEPNPWTRRLENQLAGWPSNKTQTWLKPLIQEELNAV